MIRKIIKIDPEKCNGCGACAEACHEGAIGMVEGKAVLLRDDYCDGLGDCLPACPTGAITFEEREAAAYDAAAVQARMAGKQEGGGCPGSRGRTIPREPAPMGRQGEDLPCGCPGSQSRALSRKGAAPAVPVPSRLGQWPVQIKLAPVNAPYFDGANLLVAADCTAFAYGNFHADFIAGRITLVGCPKLDMADYSEKLAEILRLNEIRSVTLVRMEVPCCGGLERAVRDAIAKSEKELPLTVSIIGVDGRVVG